MSRKLTKNNRIFLWVLVIGGFFSLLLYGLSSFIAKPIIETITTHPQNRKSNKSDFREVNSENSNTE